MRGLQMHDHEKDWRKRRGMEKELKLTKNFFLPIVIYLTI
jgi:hypothetical protein